MTDILREMILHPKQLKVEVVQMTQYFTLYIAATLSDSKRIVGSMGAHFNALKALVTAAARKAGVKAEMNQVEAVGRPVIDQYPPFTTQDDWPKEKIEKLVERMAKAVFVHDNVTIKIADGPNGSSNIEVLVSESEDAQLVADMLIVFKTLIKPVGKSNHRNLMLNVSASLPHEAQPAVADGRHMRELKR